MFKNILYLLNYFQTYYILNYFKMHYTNTRHIFNIILVYETYKHVKK